MSTPQRALWSGWKSRKDGTGSGSREPVTPVGVSGGIVDAAVPNSDRDGLPARIKKLETELLDYQYNMGLLLIEKKEWTSKVEELQHELEDVKETLKREQIAHQMAIEEVEKREENLRKALGVEKQCVHDLEKALREMRNEHAEIKFTGDSKLAEANALVTSVEDKSLELEAKLRVADAKLAEASRKNSEVERKVQDVEARENALRRDRLSFMAEREAHDSTLSNQREDLREWERKLREGEERLAEGQRILNQREERISENDRILKQKEKELEELQKRIETAHLSLRKKEDEINERIANLALKEKECDDTRQNLEMKEKDLFALEEKLNEREKAEIQKLTDEHNSLLNAKRSEFEKEIDQKRKSFDEELKCRLVEVERKEAEVNHMEEKIGKREKALENKLAKLKEKEKNNEEKMQALKEKERSIRAEEKQLETEKKKLLLDKEDLLSLKAEVEKMRADNEQKILQIHEEETRLRITEEERLDHIRLQAELKKEMDDCRQQKEQLLKEAEDMKQQKETFEKEWEELDVKRAEVEKMLEDLNNQEEKFEKLKHNEEERLRNEKQKTEDYIQKELDALKIAKQSFEATMEQEKSLASEKAQSERSKLLNDLEQQRIEMEINMQNKQEEIEKHLREKEKLVEEEKERELSKINFERDVARREMEEMKLEKVRIDKERREVAANKDQLIIQQNEMRKDIDELFGLSKKLKEQREHFIRERERFISFAERHKSCKNCGEMTYEFVLSDLQSLDELENPEIALMPKLAGEYLKDHVRGNLAGTDHQAGDIFSGAVGAGSPSSGGMSLLRKCMSKIFSPVKRLDGVSTNATEKVPVSSDKVNVNESDEQSKSLEGTGNEPQVSDAAADNSNDVEKVQFDNVVRGIEIQDPSVEDQSNLDSQAESQRDTQPLPVEGGSRGSQAGRHKPTRRGRSRVLRTRSVKAVVEDAKAILGNTSKANGPGHANGNSEDSGQIRTESRGDSGLAAGRPQRNLRKRTRAHTSQNTAQDTDGDNIEVQSKSINGNQRRKRHQRAAPAVPSSGDTRYNLRRPKRGVTVATANASVEENKKREQAIGNMQTEETNLEAGVVNENGGRDHSLQDGTLAASEDADAGLTKEEVEDVTSEEVNGTPKPNEHVGDEEDEDDEETEHPGEVSIGKKLWKFLTT